MFYFKKLFFIFTTCGVSVVNFATENWTIDGAPVNEVSKLIQKW